MQRDDYARITTLKLKQFQSDGESSREPQFKGADNQLNFFPRFRSTLGSHLTLAFLWAGRLTHLPRVSGITVSPRGLGYL